jgi:hypothetical protein
MAKPDPIVLPNDRAYLMRASLSSMTWMKFFSGAATTGRRPLKRTLA